MRRRITLTIGGLALMAMSTTISIGVVAQGSGTGAQRVDLAERLTGLQRWPVRSG